MFEKEFGIEEDRVTLFPESYEEGCEEEGYEPSWIIINVESKSYLSAFLPFFLLGLISFLITIGFAFFIPTAAILIYLIMITYLLFN